MDATNRRLLLLTASALTLLAAGWALSASASAAGVDISFTMKDADTTCRQWTPGTPSVWNFSLAMNGTDSSLIETPTWVYLDNSQAPDMVADNWVPILTGSAAVGYNPTSYNSQDSNELAIGSGVYAPGAQTLDLALYSSAHIPAAPPTNVTLQLTPSEDSENKDHNFTVTAQTHRTGAPTVTRRIPVCVHIPPKPRFEMFNTTASLQAAADSDITVSFTLHNTGNTQDWYYCNVSVPRDDWTWTFQQGINVGPNITDLLQLNQTIFIRVRVHVPDNALARENSTVSLNCTSIKANPPLFVYPPYTRIEVNQYYYIFARIVGDSTIQGIPGDQVRFNFEVQNLGNGPDTGVVRVVAPTNFSWNAIPSPERFDLGPRNNSQDQASGQFLVDIPNGTAVFTYDFYLNVTSDGTIIPPPPVTQLRFHVQVRQIYVPIVSPVPSENGTTGQEVVFSFTIKNGGNYLDSLLIEIINISDWRVFLSPPIGEKLLQAGEEAAFQATVIVPKEEIKAQVGTYSQTVRITSKYARLDLGTDVFVETPLTIIIKPRVSCTLEPPESDKELNPFTFPGNITTANYILSLNNTGNGNDALNLTATFPDGFNVTIQPTHLQLTIHQIKQVLVSIVAPPALEPGIYVVTVIAHSEVMTNVSCQSEYRLNIYHLDASLSTTIQSTIQNPENPSEEVQPVTLSEIQQVEGFLIKFRLIVSNSGQRAIAAGSLQLIVWDTFDCEGKTPVEATNTTCSTVKAFNWTNPTNIITGVGGSVPVEVFYTVPDYACFDSDVCHRSSPPPPANPHHLVFQLVLSSEGTTANNIGNVTVQVLPKAILAPPQAVGRFPIEIVGSAGVVAGMVGFAFWYRFIRKPKVDEDLYASIYGGGVASGPGPQGAQTAQGSIGDYLQQQGATEAQHTTRPQGMTDEQLEEARRLYGDNYGR